MATAAIQPLIKRECTLQLTIEDLVQPLHQTDVLEYFETKGFHSEDFVSCQKSHNEGFLITFQNNMKFMSALTMCEREAPKIKDTVLSAIRAPNICEVKAPQLTTLHIFGAPHELDDQCIRARLEDHVVVVSMFRGRLRDPKYRHVESGIRHIKFSQIKKPIPTFIYVKNTRLNLRYDGQDLTLQCDNCKRHGHTKDECREPHRPLKCRVCGDDHRISNCQQWKQILQERKQNEENPPSSSSTQTVKTNPQGPTSAPAAHKTLTSAEKWAQFTGNTKSHQTRKNSKKTDDTHDDPLTFKITNPPQTDTAVNELTSIWGDNMEPVKNSPDMEQRKPKRPRIQSPAVSAGDNMLSDTTPPDLVIDTDTSQSDSEPDWDVLGMGASPLTEEITPTNPHGMDEYSDSTAGSSASCDSLVGDSAVTSKNGCSEVPMENQDAPEIAVDNPFDSSS